MHNGSKIYDRDRTKYLKNNHGISEVIRVKLKDLAINTDVVIKQVIEPLLDS